MKFLSFKIGYNKSEITSFLLFSRKICITLENVRLCTELKLCLFQTTPLTLGGGGEGGESTFF
jgi:hypothetical protein